MDNEQTSIVNCSLLPVNCLNLDVGFKCFKLDTSNLKLWDSAPIRDEDLQTLFDRMNAMIHHVKNDRSDMDMVYEIMLKMGVPLNFTVKSIIWTFYFSK